MEKPSKNATTGAVLSTMTPRSSRIKNQETSKYPENFNPNLLLSHSQQQQSPGSKTLTLVPNPKSSSTSSSSSPVVNKSCSVKKSQKLKNPNNNSPKNKIRQRKFVVAKKKQKKDENEGHDANSSCNCKDKKEGDAAAKCPCVAYENLRKSQEEFFKDRPHHDEDEGEEEAVEIETSLEEKRQQEEKQGLIVKRNRERLMEEGRQSVTQIGSGKVMSLIKAFENLLSESPISKDQEDHKENEDKVMKWPPSNLTLTSQNLGLDPRASVSSSWDSTRESSVSTRTSNGGRRSRRNSLESSTTLGGGRRWRKKQQKVTSLRPFKLRTEQRGKLKEEEFVKKIQEIMTEEEKQRIPIAQGLPWTTDEPECLVKPPVKEITIPVDLKLHTDVRALDRAEFDQQIAEKLSFIEQYKLERERERKLAEEEEIKRLRKELVPKAQPMPYFDRPFIPRRSMKNPTMPRTPKLRKKIKCSIQSWNDINPYSSSSCLN